jgi:hypothetical protein
MNPPVKMNRFSALVLICIIFFAVSCSSSKKAGTALLMHLQDSLPVLPASEIDLPVKIFAPPLLARAESIVPKEFTSDGWPNYFQPSCDFRYKYRFVRSGFGISCTDNAIGVQMTGNYQVTGGRCFCSLNKPISPWISGSCGFADEPMRRVNISIRSQLDFLPSYQVRSATSVNQVQALDRCQVSLFSTDVTQLIVDSIRSSISVFCSILDETIAELSFSGLLERSAEKSFYKANLGPYGFLSLHPSLIRIGQLNFQKDSFNISAGLTCNPELSSDSSGNKLLNTLPPLQEMANRNGISLYLNAIYDYAFLSKIISDTLHNKVFEIKGRTIVVKDVLIRGIGNHQVEVRVDFAGSNRGSIYLRGTPVLDTVKQTLSIPDISYSLESKDLILKIAKSLFRNKVRKTLQGQSYLDIAALVKTNLPAMDAQINRQLTKDISISGKTHEVKLIGLLAQKNALQIQLFVEASLSIISDGQL